MNGDDVDCGNWNCDYDNAMQCPKESIFPPGRSFLVCSPSKDLFLDASTMPPRLLLSFFLFLMLFSEQCSPLLSGHHYHFSGLGHLPVSAVSLGGKGARARLGPAKLSIKTNREQDKSFQETK